MRSTVNTIRFYFRNGGMLEFQPQPRRDHHAVDRCVDPGKRRLHPKVLRLDVQEKDRDLEVHAGPREVPVGGVILRSNRGVQSGEVGSPPRMAYGLTIGRGSRNRAARVRGYTLAFPRRFWIRSSRPPIRRTKTAGRNVRPRLRRRPPCRNYPCRLTGGCTTPLHQEIAVTSQCLGWVRGKRKGADGEYGQCSTPFSCENHVFPPSGRFTNIMLPIRVRFGFFQVTI